VEAVVAPQIPVKPAEPAGDAVYRPPAEGAAAAPGEAPSDGAPAETSAAPVWVLSTYFAEGHPYALAHKVAAEFFTAVGANLGAIGLVSLFGLPWNLKFLWSPLVDMHGTIRRWVLGAEIVLTLLVLALAWPANSGSLWFMAAGFAAVAFAAATHDIAIDGFYLYALDKRRQAAFTGLRVSAYRGALLFGGFLVAIAGWTSWRNSFLAAGVTLALLTVVHAVLLPDPRRDPASRPRFFEAFRAFLKMRQLALVLAFVVLYRAGDALMFAMNSPLLKSLELDTAARGLVGGVAGTVASICGSMLGGVIIARYSLRRTIFPIALAQSLAILLYVALAWLRPPLPGIIAIVLMEQFVAGIGTAAFVVVLMRRCAGTYKASHFAILSALMSFAATGFGSVSGYVALAIGFPAFFMLAYVMSIPGVILSRYVPTE
jgi:PAT family beta-lactamase induction signal transducer AmpG